MRNAEKFHPLITAESAENCDQKPNGFFLLIGSSTCILLQLDATSRNSYITISHNTIPYGTPNNGGGGVFFPES